MSGPRDRLDDDLLARHLQRRAARAQLSSVERARLIAAATATQVALPAAARWNVFSGPLAAALVVVALVVGVVVVGSIPTEPGTTPPAPPAATGTDAVPTSAPPSASAAPRLDGIRVLNPGELERVVEAATPGGMGTVVVADVSLEVGTERDSSCHPGGTCPIGRLRLPGGPKTVVAEEDVRLRLPRPGEVLDSSLALSVTTSWAGPRVTLLGAVQPGSQGLSSTVPDVLAQVDEIDAGHLLVVEGWLVASSEGTIRCSRRGGVASDALLRCDPRGWVAESADEPVESAEGSGWLQMPGPALTVQPWPWDAAPGARPGNPQQAAYLVEAREDVSVDCGGCQQWRVLGRIDPAASLPLAPPSFRIMTSSEIAALLVAPTQDGRTVLAQGPIVADEYRVCMVTDTSTYWRIRASCCTLCG
ncbi:MAG: hypothetical protein H0V12_05785 [Chloroflexi bacterium]|nr:hypothetical protein [Chloroflexota bacterium]